jgi:hypothetical protein
MDFDRLKTNAFCEGNLSQMFDELCLSGSNQFVYLYPVVLGVDVCVYAAIALSRRSLYLPPSLEMLL